MPYADGRRYCDADSHLLELHDWLPRYADPGIRARIRPLYLGGAGGMAEQAVRDAAARRGDPAAARALEAELMNAKGWNALGAFDPAERSRALDLLGFAQQLVFSTFAPTQFAGDDLDLPVGFSLGSRAELRVAIGSFSDSNPRTIPPRLSCNGGFGSDLRTRGAPLEGPSWAS
jgi:hypothetical protein